MLVVPAPERASAFANVTGWYNNLVRNMRTKSGSSAQVLSLPELIANMQSFTAAWQAYSSAPSADSWQPVANYLINFGNYAQIMN